MEYGIFLISVIDMADQQLRLKRRNSLIEVVGMKVTAMILIKKTLRMDWRMIELLSRQLNQSICSLSSLSGLFSTLATVSFYNTSDEIMHILHPSRKFIRLVADIGILYHKSFQKVNTSEELNELQTQAANELLQKVLNL